MIRIKKMKINPRAKIIKKQKKSGPGGTISLVFAIKRKREKMKECIMIENQT